VVTINDVAERAGVSLGTVSRVLNGHPSVRPGVRAAVKSAIGELGYVPNPAARSLRSSRTLAVGLVVPDLMSPMTITLLRGVEDAVQAAGYTLLVAESRLDAELETTHITNLLDRRVDGLLCSPVQPVAAIERLIRGHSATMTPTVLLQLRTPRREFPSAYVDEGPAIDACIDHLVRLGHTRIALVHSASRVAGSRHRRDLVRASVERRGIVEDGDLDRMFADAEECYRSVRALLGNGQPPSALIVGIHQFVPAALQAIHDAGVRIPEDVSLVVFGDSDWARATMPSLNTIVIDQAQHAAGAMDLLLRSIRGESASARSFRSESTYIIRASAGPANGTLFERKVSS
jgi:LacI family transcriptional regulator